MLLKEQAIYSNSADFKRAIMDMTEEEILEDLANIEIREDGKLAHGLRCFYEEQLTELIRGLWADPHWEKLIRERCVESLPKLALVPIEGVN